MTRAAAAQAMTERELQHAIVECAQLLGWRVYHPYDSRKSAPGYPDLTLVKNGVLIFAELKTATGKVSDDQQVWLDDLACVHKTRAMLVRPADLSDFVAMLQGENDASR